MDKQTFYLAFVSASAGFGLAIFLPSLSWFRRKQMLARKGHRVKAVVVSEESPEESSYYSLEVEFIDHRRRRRQAQIATLKSPGVGKPIEILYDPENPSAAISAASDDLWFSLPAFLVYFGGMWLLVSLIMLVMGLIVGVGT